MTGVGVVIPVYNVEKYLRRCLDSVCAQSDCVKEIILVNDGSTDGSLGICKEFAQKDGRIKIIDRENGGSASAVIDGVNAATCDCIGFVDSDDYIEPNMFRELYNALEQHNADVAFCDYDSSDENGNTFYRRDFGIERSGLYTKQDGSFPINIVPTFSDGKYITGFRWNKLFRRELLVNNIAFKKVDIRLGEDIALTLPVIMSANSIVYVKECLYHYVQRGDSIIHTYKSRNIDDWQSVNGILFDAAKEYDYKLSNCKEAQLCFLLHNCLSKLRHSDLGFSQKKAEYKHIGENASVGELLKTVKIVGGFKRKLIFGLLRHKQYGLLALIY